MNYNFFLISKMTSWCLNNDFKAPPVNYPPPYPNPSKFNGFYLKKKTIVFNIGKLSIVSSFNDFAGARISLLDRYFEVLRSEGG